MKTHRQIYEELYKTKMQKYFKQNKYVKNSNVSTLKHSRQANIYAIKNTNKEWQRQLKGK